MSTTLHTAAERPDLWERGIDSADVWPEYNLHGDVLNRFWPHLDEELADYQFVLYDDEADEVVAEGHTGPLWWDGDDATLPAGIDDALEEIFARARAGEPVNTLCALAAETPRTGRARGMAERILAAMSELARRNGLARVIAPVRPSTKPMFCSVTKICGAFCAGLGLVRRRMRRASPPDSVTRPPPSSTVLRLATRGWVTTMVLGLAP